MNKDWPRWIYSSVAVHFNDRKEDIALYFDRYDRDTDWAEFRLDGPFIEELSIGFWRVELTVNILITSFIGDDDYKIHRMVGTIGEAFTDICCYRYGDDDSYLGSLSIVPTLGSKINITQFGNISPENRFRRSSVEAAFRMYLP